MLVQVDQTPGSADHNFQSLGELLDLRLVGNTAVQGCHAGIAQFRGYR